MFAALGVLSIAYPQLLGNGKNVVQLALVAQLAAGLTAVLLVLKPLSTAGCLGSGAPGGLFTPTLAVGVLLGSLGGRAWALLWPGVPLGTYAVVGGAAVLAASMQAPLAAIVLMLELTHRAEGLLVPIMLAVVGATVVSRRMGAHSIYSARLTVGREEEAAAIAAEREGDAGVAGAGGSQKRSSTRSIALVPNSTASTGRRSSSAWISSMKRISAGSCIGRKP